MGYICFLIAAEFKPKNVNVYLQAENGILGLVRYKI
jgi:acyl CoA:acetate/3-ketoacid CoA transferase beta subunit